MTEPNVKWTGPCLCGAIRYRAAGVPEWVAFCHCESCRRATGAPTTAYAGFLRERFCYFEGKPERFSSSPGVVRSFCGRCGTPLTYEGDRWPGEVHVLVGTLDHPERHAPGRRLRRRKAALAASCWRGPSLTRPGAIAEPGFWARAIS